MGPTGNSYRVLQIHPTRRCNLRCLHCYSSSGPEESSELSLTLLCNALTDASKEKYTVAGISGGEPLLYKPLRELLEHAHQCGMITTVTSNGMLLTERRLETLRGVVDLLAISLDGGPASHNRMRASERAFEMMAARLDGVRRSGIPFGFIFTLTQHNLHELDWVANFALEQGAKLLQIHPLEEVGRANTFLPGVRPDKIELAYAYLETQRIRSIVGDRLYVQLDLVNRKFLQAHPGHIFADSSFSEEANSPLADIVSPLVIEADGTLVPLQYGFSRAYVFGNLHNASLRELALRWRWERYQSFRALCERVFEEVTVPTDLPFANWYEVIARRAEHVPAG
jgi:MoaA/NifB/PqqE/SkfB family radical SAM enzyme